MFNDDGRLRAVVEKLWFEKGFPCAVLFVGDSHRCGYVGLPKKHKWYEKDYEKIDIDVHGGLTFGRKDFIIEGFWWIGFDCAHLGDKYFVSCLEKTFLAEEEHFWTTKEVEMEVKKMIKQL